MLGTLCEEIQAALQSYTGGGGTLEYFNIVSLTHSMRVRY